MSDLKDQTIEAAISAAASKSTYAGAFISIGGWVFSSEFAAFIGSAIGFVGVLVNWYYKHQQNEREKQEHNRRMALYD